MPIISYRTGDRCRFCGAYEYAGEPYDRSGRRTPPATLVVEMVPGDVFGASPVSGGPAYWRRVK